MAKTLTLGARLKTARKEIGLSQPQLAKKLGVHPGSIWGWESDNTTPKEAVLEKIEAFIATADARRIPPKNGTVTLAKAVERAAKSAETFEAEQKERERAEAYRNTPEANAALAFEERMRPVGFTKQEQLDRYFRILLQFHKAPEELARTRELLACARDGGYSLDGLIRLFAAMS